MAEWEQHPARGGHGQLRSRLRPLPRWGALVAAGYLGSDELGVVELTTLSGDLTRVSIDSLVSELRHRVLAAGVHHGAQSWPAGWAADDPAVGRAQDHEQSGDLHG